ncbi:MAG: hypothetical protein V4631_16580 [Pseudomonadota bacterium]
MKLKILPAILVAAAVSLCSASAYAHDPVPNDGKVHPVAETKKAAKAVGHATKKATKAVGHTTRKTTKAIGHGTRKVTRDIGHAFRDGAREATGKN